MKGSHFLRAQVVLCVSVLARTAFESGHLGWLGLMKMRLGAFIGRMSKIGMALVESEANFNFRPGHDQKPLYHRCQEFFQQQRLFLY